MTFGKWKKLFMVALVPLLLLGYFMTRSVIPESASITCRQSFDENCDNWGSDFNQRVLEFEEAWFDITHPHDTKPYISALGSTRIHQNARILHAEAYYTSNEQISDLNGRTLTIKLGWNTKQSSYEDFLQAPNFILCNRLGFTNSTDQFEASECRNADWHGYVTFALTGVELERAISLRNSLETQIRNSIWKYRLYQIFAFPIFVYLFFLISFAAWLCIKAFKFVKTG